MWNYCIFSLFLFYQIKEEKRILSESVGQEELLQKNSALGSEVEGLKEEATLMKEQISRLEEEVEIARNLTDSQRLDALLEQSKNFEVRISLILIGFVLLPKI